MDNKVKRCGKQLINLGLGFIEKTIKFKTDPTGFIPSRWRMLKGTYESFLIENILSRLPETGVFIDVGANVGYISKFVAKNRSSANTIIAVEPNPRLQAILKYNLSGFDSCKILSLGLSSKIGILEFYHGKDSATGSFIKDYNKNHHFHHKDYKVTSTHVAIERGDVLFANVPSIDVMKVDVEGFEFEVLKGFSQLLLKGNIKNIFFEFNVLSQQMGGVQGKEIIEYLNKFGYQVYGLEGNWNGAIINDRSVYDLAHDLGKHGYTTLVATYISS